ncbi:unnamed protein product [Polarella glacialis]|uniref:Uncharacterized protein n=1 Tax=Polarella glacialis TaxID=89957 RepID=A0A813LEI5_POLGL|nr:unnamed protein product [Polarella glacialis]
MLKEPVAGETIEDKTNGKKEKRAKKEKKPLSAAQEAKIVGALMEGVPGISSPKPLPLSSLTKHRGVAWQWKEGGKMQYPIPIGCSRPLSPFDSEDD